MRWIAGLALMGLAAAAGYLGGRAAHDPVPQRAATPDRTVLDPRITALEYRLDQLEARAAEARQRPAAAAPGTEPAAGPAPAGATPRDRVAMHDTGAKGDTEKQKREWVERFQEARTPQARVAILRDAGVQLKRHASPATARAFFEEMLATVDPASEEGIFLTFELGHFARGDGDYAASDAFYRRVEGVVPVDSVHYAHVQFQLAWNRKYAGEPQAAEQLFRRAADSAAAEPTTRVAALYALAGMRGDAQDARGVKAELERLLAVAKEHPGDLGVAYYVDLAKKLLASLG